MHCLLEARQSDLHMDLYNIMYAVYYEYYMGVCEKKTTQNKTKQKHSWISSPFKDISEIMQYCIVCGHEITFVISFIEYVALAN